MKRTLTTPAVIFFLIAVFVMTYSGSLKVLFFGDELFAYFFPTLQMSLHPENFLPWNYHPEMTFGHPPLSYLVYAMTFKSWQSIETVRITSIILTAAGIWGAFLVGKNLSSKSVGLLLATLYISHIAVWEVGNLFLPDNLFVALFTFFFYFLIKENKTGILVTGIFLVLLRETFLICSCAFLLKELISLYRGRKSSLLPVLSVVVGLQFLWFIFLTIRTGHPTGLYNSDGFVLEWEFFRSVVTRISYGAYILSGWIILICLTIFFAFRDRIKFWETFTRFWPLLVISILFLTGLSFIETSVVRYQLVGIFCLGAFLVTFLDRVLPARALWALIIILFSWNYYLRDNYMNHFEKISTAGPSAFYSCAEQLRNWDPPAVVSVVDFEILYLVRHLKAFTEFKPENHQTRMKFLFRFKIDIEEKFDYIVLVKNKTPHLNRFMKKLLNRPDMELIHPSGTESCMIFKKN